METELGVVRSFDVSLEGTDRSSSGGMVLLSLATSVSVGSGAAGSSLGIVGSFTLSMMMVRFSNEVSRG